MNAPTDVPRHVAIIMDGNGRWANRQGLKRTDGHVAGERALWDTTLAAIDQGIEVLTVYAFSTENWKRSPAEVKFLLDFNVQQLRERVDGLHQRNVRIRFIGDRGRPVPKRQVREFEAAEAKTADNTGMTLVMAFNYGGQSDIVRAVRQLAVDPSVSLANLDAATLEQALDTGDLPPVDLLIRTSGEQRLSNFLLWQAAYAELVFTETLWPDFGADELQDALRAYAGRQRRFGGALDEPAS